MHAWGRDGEEAIVVLAPASAWSVPADSWYEERERERELLCVGVCPAGSTSSYVFSGLCMWESMNLCMYKSVCTHVCICIGISASVYGCVIVHSGQGEKHFALISPFHIGEMPPCVQLIVFSFFLSVWLSIKEIEKRESTDSVITGLFIYFPFPAFFTHGHAACT